MFFYLYNIQKRYVFLDPLTGEERDEMGWIADEVQRVAPELVITMPMPMPITTTTQTTSSEGSSPEEAYKGVAYGRASPLVAEAVNELRQRSEAQVMMMQTQIDELRRENDELRSMMRHLMTMMEMKQTQTQTQMQ